MLLGTDQLRGDTGWAWLVLLAADEAEGRPDIGIQNHNKYS